MAARQEFYQLSPAPECTPLTELSKVPDSEFPICPPLRQEGMAGGGLCLQVGSFVPLPSNTSYLRDLVAASSEPPSPESLAEMASFFLPGHSLVLAHVLGAPGWDSAMLTH